MKVQLLLSRKGCSLLLGIGLLFGCQSPSIYEVEITEIGVGYESMHYPQFISFDSILAPQNVGVEVAIYNPSDDDVTIDGVENEYSLDWVFGVDTVRLRTIGVNTVVEFPKGQKVTHPFYVRPQDFYKLASVFKSKDIMGTHQRLQQNSTVVLTRWQSHQATRYSFGNLKPIINYYFADTVLEVRP